MPTITAGGTPQTITLPEGQVLNVSGSAGTAGVVYRLNQALGGTNSLQSWPVKLGILAAIGPYAGQQRFLVTCAAGEVTANVAAARPPSQRQRSSIGTELIGGYLAPPVVVGATPYNELMQFTLPTDCDAMAVTLLNADAAEVAGVKVSVGFGSTLGAANGTLGLAASGLPIGGALTKCTQNGNATGTLSAASEVSTGPGGSNIGGSACGYGTFDMTYCPTVPRVDGNDLDKPVGYISITWPPGSKRTFIEMNGTTSLSWQNEGSQPARIAPYGHPRRVMTSAGGDAQNNPAFYLASNGATRSHTQFPAAMIHFSMRSGEVETWLLPGDSLAAGSGATPQYCCLLDEIRALVSTPKNPMCVVNLAVPGSDMTKILQRVLSVIDVFAGVNALVASATVNSLGSPITQTSLNLIRRDYAGIRKLLDRQRIFNITATCPATGTTWKQYGYSDSLRLANNDFYLTSGIPCLPLAESIVGPTVTVPTGPQAGQPQQSIAPRYTIDEIHPITPGYQKQADDVCPMWMAL